MSGTRVSIPGQHPYLVADADPYALLTPGQLRVVDAVRARNWNRSEAARDLGVTVQSVQVQLRLAREVGFPVPPGVVGRYRRPDLRPRKLRA